MRHEIFAEGTSQTHWLAGLVAADGSVRNKQSWSFSQSGDDGRATVEHVRSLIGHTLKVSEYDPKGGRTAHKIYVPSVQMVSDLQKYYGIGPRKSLTYAWPGLNGSDAADFLAGFIDGDGCVKTYLTPQGSDFLHISFVGIPEFVADASSVIPAKGHVRRHPQCKDLSEIRYSGRHAWDAGKWIYASPAARASRKYWTYHNHTMSARPQWLILRERRELVRQELSSGRSLRKTAELIGVSLATVCVWKKQFAMEATDNGGHDAVHTHT